MKTLKKSHVFRIPYKKVLIIVVAINSYLHGFRGSCYRRT